MSNVLQIPEASKIDIVVHVLIPSGELWKARFGMCLALMMADFAQNRTAPYVRSQRAILHNAKSSMLQNLRETSLRAAQQSGANYALFLDTDMVFPGDTLRRLISRGKPIIGANYSTKSVDRPTFTACVGNDALVTDESSTGIVKVDHLGCGVMLINLAAIVEVKEPWFNSPWIPEVQEFAGEDVTFCRKARECGVEIFVDQDLSKEVAHIGEIHFSWDTTSRWMKMRGS